METQAPVTEATKLVAPINNKAYLLMQASTLGITLSADQVTTMQSQDEDVINASLVAIMKAQPTVTLELSEADTLNLHAMGAGRRDQKLKEHKKNFDNYIKQAHDYQQVVSEALAHAAKIKGEMILLEQGTQDVDIAAQVREAVLNPFYKFHKVTKDSIEFTTAPVILRWEKKQAGVKYEINLGKFLVRIKLQAGDATILPYEDNLKTNNGYIHPHIRNDAGSVCWGNASNGIHAMTKQYNILPALGAVEAFLHTYNDGSSYADIYKFYERELQASQLKGKLGDTMISDADLATAQKYVLGIHPRRFTETGVASNRIGKAMKDKRDIFELLTLIDSPVALDHHERTSYTVLVEAYYLGDNMYVKMIDGSYAYQQSIHAATNAFFEMNKDYTLGYEVSRNRGGNCHILNKELAMQLEDRIHIGYNLSSASLAYILGGNTSGVREQVRKRALTTLCTKFPKLLTEAAPQDTETDDAIPY